MLRRVLSSAREVAQDSVDLWLATAISPACQDVSPTEDARRLGRRPSAHVRTSKGGGAPRQLFYGLDATSMLISSTESNDWTKLGGVQITPVGPV